MGFIFRFGTRIQAFAWTVVPILQPLSAAFFPLQILPYPLQLFAQILPSTFVFEAGRANLVNNHVIYWHFHLIAFAENIIYVALAMVIFNYLFKKSKETGQFARNEA
jgi:ABC-2 type transport system permease protein